jgi:hypothetical protein
MEKYQEHTQAMPEQIARNMFQGESQQDLLFFFKKWFLHIMRNALTGALFSKFFGVC